MSGQTPCAKRPVTQSTIAIAAGGHKPMNMDDLVAGFHNVANLRERDEKWSVDISKCVEWNATLLNTLVTRVNVIDATVARQTESINQLNGGVKTALEQASMKHEGKEYLLRGELSAMAEKLEASHDELQKKMSRLESMQLTPPPGIAPNTELLSMNMNKLNTTVEDVKGKIQILEKHAEQTIGRTRRPGDEVAVRCQERAGDPGHDDRTQHRDRAAQVERGVGGSRRQYWQYLYF